MVELNMNFLQLFNKKNLIAAHRGASKKAPENTLRALNASIGKSDFMEVDVQLSRDGIPVIIHDDTLSRTTNVEEIEIYKAREPYLVSDFSYEELSALDYGSWFDSYEPLLTLRGVLKFIKEKKVFVNIEIKDIHNCFSDEEVVSIVLGEIEKFGVEDFVMLSSFRHEYLPLCKQILPSVVTAALVENEHPKNLIKYLKLLKVDAYNMDDELVDREVVAELREVGFFVNVYTVNDNIRAKELFGMGVNGVFSDI